METIKKQLELPKGEHKRGVAGIIFARVPVLTRAADN
jgi:hypothetical protein